MTLTPVPAGRLAAVVTYLEMTERPDTGPPIASALELPNLPRPDPLRYRKLFRRVGAPWL